MRKRRTWLAALLLAVVGIVAAALPAAGSPGADPTRIDPTTTGSVTFHRYTGHRLDPDKYPDNGTKIDLPPTASPLAGVVFTLRLIDSVDLTTTAGWQQAVQYRSNMSSAVSAAAAGRTWVSPPTGADGATTVSGLPIGLYLVQETSLPAGIAKAPDTLVTVPMQNPTQDGQWMYNIHVYPKADTPGIEKSVTDGDAGADGRDAPVAGKVLTYTFRSDLPGDGLRGLGGACLRGGRVNQGVNLDGAGYLATGWCAPGATWSGRAGGGAYRIVDDLATMQVPGTSLRTSDFLEFAGAGWVGTLTAATPNGGLTACTTATTTTCDYVVTRTASRLQIDFTDRGMAALARAHTNGTPEPQLEVNVQARVKASVTEKTFQSAGQLAARTPAFVLNLPNEVLLFPSGPALRGGTPSRSQTVVTAFTTLKLHKVNSNTGRGLAGAVFTLYRTLDDARAGRNPLAVSAPTDASGMTQFAGLHVTDFQNNGPDNDSYWVVESTVPNGFIGLSGPFEVKVLRSGATVGADASLGLPVSNTPTATGSQLPQTGASFATLVAFGLGLAFLVAGSLVLARRRRGH